MKRSALVRTNTCLLKMLNEENTLLNVTFVYSQRVGLGLSYYEFPPSALGIHRASDFIIRRQERLFGIPYAQECYLYPLSDFRGDVSKLSGVINRMQGHYPEPGEVYAFINHRHNQIKLYWIQNGVDCIQHLKLPSGTFPVRRNLNRSPFDIISWTELMNILKPCWEERR